MSHYKFNACEFFNRRYYAGPVVLDGVQADVDRGHALNGVQGYVDRVDARMFLELVLIWGNITRVTRAVKPTPSRFYR